MWWRFLTFCILVSLILMVVLSYIHGRPVVHLFFKRCCDEDIENEEVIFENFANNFLRERMMAVEIIESNGTFVPADVDVGEIINTLREKLNVHTPGSRTKWEEIEKNEKDLEDLENSSDSVTEGKTVSEFEENTNSDVVTESLDNITSGS